MGAADATRLALCTLGAAVDDWGKVAARIEAAAKAAPGILAAMIRDTPAIADRADAVARDLITRNGVSSRDAMMSAALTAGWWWWSCRRDDSIVRAEAQRSEAQDAADALLEILSLRVRAGSGMEESALRCLTRLRDAERVADLLGMRLEPDGTLLIATGHQGLARAVRRTSLESVNLRRLLLQLPGSEWDEPAPLPRGAAAGRVAGPQGARCARDRGAAGGKATGTGTETGRTAGAWLVTTEAIPTPAPDRPDAGSGSRKGRRTVDARGRV